ncbi:hypothetical protein [Haladaptatus sp. YSMS36]|uniref:hypothetical protein n=1 Tax=Haladaptatus sp. YSMS36 TaxID=3033384 RepID=UPI0023E7ADA0|nr:hypothetical protein [Haladaptatus sp. YSMS36]
MIEIRSMDDELDFAGIVDHLTSAIEAGKERGATIAVDVTPGRKFMSAIAFQVGFKYEADHIFYFHLNTRRRSKKIYPEIPRLDTETIDFTEVF